MRGLGPGFGSPAITVQSLRWAPTPSAGARTWQIYGRVLHGRCATLKDVAVVSGRVGVQKPSLRPGLSPSPTENKRRGPEIPVAL